MKIAEVKIKNFRSIGPEGVTIKPNALTILIGDNGTSKTTIIEAINYCLSPSFLGGKLKHSDFHNGEDEEIEIIVTFDTPFTVSLPDGYTKQNVTCKSVVLKAHKRERAANGKAFSDVVVTEHYVLPEAVRGASGWSIRRGTGTEFKYDERLLSFPVASSDLPRAFYFSKTRDRQIKSGYSSSISSVIDDLNWRFAKKDRTKDPIDKFAVKKSEFEDKIIEDTDGDTINKTFEVLNTKLGSLNIEPVDLSFMDANAPYDSLFLAKKLSALDLPVASLGSGIEMIVCLLFLETMASLSREKVIILIDEPEVHLHPTLQDNLMKYLNELAKEQQVIFSTHSPYFFKNGLAHSGGTVLLTKRDDSGLINIAQASDESAILFPWSPSWGEINYRAYGICTVEFHNELYGRIQEIENKPREAEVEQFFENSGYLKSKTWVRVRNGVAEPGYLATLMTFVRNTIHHPENRQNADYTYEELEESIKNMISIIEADRTKYEVQ
jgi:energy-coupling factor transporter ATP-binding protein EcfA2